MIKLKPFKQSKGYCGPASLKMVLSAYGIKKSEDYLAKLTKSSRIKGCKETNIIKVAKKFGFNGYAKQNSNIKELKALVNNKIPVIVAWTSPEEGGHYSVVVGFDNKNIFIADPHFGKVKKHKIKWFEKRWKEKEPQTYREIMAIQEK
jgi:ABC-type bacteriocin/lantibiotic exporter with double-glycine peptidase domain